MRRKVEHLESKVVVKAAVVSSLRVPETGAELADWLRDRGWDYWRAEMELHVPWFIIRDACVYKDERLPHGLLQALKRFVATSGGQNVGQKRGKIGG